MSSNYNMRTRPGEYFVAEAWNAPCLGRTKLEGLPNTEVITIRKPESYEDLLQNMITDAAVQ